MTLHQIPVTVDPQRADTPATRWHRKRGGRQLDASWVTYLLVGLVTLVSIFPLYYTIVMASHTNAEMASPDRPVAAQRHALSGNLEQGPRAGPAQQGPVQLADRLRGR